jgi:hypothetical protein
VISKKLSEHSARELSFPSTVGGEGTHNFSDCVAKRRSLFPGGTERVAGGGAERHPRNAVPKTAHPAEGGRGFVPRVISGTPCRGAVPGGAAFRRCRFAQPSATFRDASGIGSSPPHAGSSRFFRCVSPAASWQSTCPHPLWFFGLHHFDEPLRFYEKPHRRRGPQRDPLDRPFRERPGRRADRQGSRLPLHPSRGRSQRLVEVAPVPAPRHLPV